MFKNALKFLLVFVISLSIYPTNTSAQYTRYWHADVLNISTTPIDTTWTTPWETATFYADTVDIYVRVGAPDVGGWSSRAWLRVPNGLSIAIGPSPTLKKIEVKTVNGSGKLYIVGYKKERQY